MEKRVFSTAEAAEYLGIQAQTLRLARSPCGQGRFAWEAPEHVKAGRRVVYTREALEAWLERYKVRPGPGRKPAAHAAAK